MSSPKRTLHNPIFVAAAAALLVLAQQIAGKVVRDTLFLSAFPARTLSVMMIGAALVSLPAVLPFSRALGTWGPGRAVPLGFLASAALFAVEWGLSRTAPGLVAILLYLHLAVAGAALVSGFWSVVNERFDPRTARRTIGRVVAAAALGGAIAGFLTDKVAGHLSAASLLPWLAALQVACAGLVWRLGGGATGSASAQAVSFAGAPSGLSAIRRSSYLRDLALLTVVVTVSQGLLEFVFKVRAQQVGPSSAELQRVLARVHTLTSLGIFGAQALFSRWSLERLGVARTLLSLPMTAAAGAGAALVVPGLGSAAGAATAEGIVHNSLYRSGYELLYAPLAPNEKRSAKSIIDVGFGRLGDLSAGGLAWLAPLVFVAQPLAGLLALALVLSLLAVWIGFRLRRSYLRVLGERLIERATEADLAMGEDALTRTAVFDTIQLMSVAAPPPRELSPATPDPSTLTGIFRRPEARELAGDLETRFAALRSRDPARAREVLQSAAPLAPDLVPVTVPLLAHETLASDALLALRRVSARSVGQLTDALLDPGQHDAVRRRLPRVLSAEPSERAVDGLLRGLEDRRFEVRNQCGLALSRIHTKAPEIAIPSDRVLKAIEREAEVDRPVWESRQALDWDPVAPSDPVDVVVRERSNQSLEHVFTLLSLVLPRSHLRTAYQGLHTKDPMLRGTALEYLDAVLPPTVRDKLWRYLSDEAPRSRTTRPKEAVMADLERLSESIVIRIDELRRDEGGPES